MTKSRGGIILGCVEFLLLLVFAAACSGRGVWRWIFAGVAAMSVVVAGYYIIDSGILNNLQKIIPETDSRMRLIKRSWIDFKGNPIFGQGIGNLSNADIYAGKKGTLPWYHMMIPQIIGSMGIVGVAAYGYQFINRIRLTVRKYSSMFYTCALARRPFVMSQVIPGEFLSASLMD